MQINEKDKEVDIFVEKIVHHEHYILDLSPFDISNDISLIKLNESLDFEVKHKHLSPICLARKETKLTDKCVATGFGAINNHRQLPINGVLQKINEPLTNVDRCKKLFPSVFNETQSVCAGGSSTGGKGVCRGDSGGPLQFQAVDGRWYQVGIASYVSPKGCAFSNLPDVFTKVSAYVDWIENTISKH